MATLWDTFNSLSFVTLFISFPANLFIIAVNILDFFKSRRLLLSDLLISGISTANLLYGFLKVFLRYYSLWISVEHYKISVHVRRFPKLFPGIIITFLLGCFFLNLLSSLETNQDCLSNTTTTVIQVARPKCSWSTLIILAIYTLGTFLCSVSALTILISLLKHMKRIQQNTEGPGSPNMEAHIRAIKTITSLLAANILMFTSVFVIAFAENILIFIFNFLISLCDIFSSYFFYNGNKKTGEKAGRDAEPLLMF
ncbi:hypothetical protein GDO78_019848 [Eleutherodactylus coqui]|uniref:Taste receptor type 2 member 40 n=1 Tax=Eleutherodactylus coqui TaxID=57060 RepID=A0A8J6E633_ELECQ|nr:hypothetical protein GDO78_019848 [Eleutherodactylus coqui]